MSARLAQQDRQRKLAARDMMEREWGQRDRDKAVRFRLSDYLQDRSVIR